MGLILPHIERTESGRWQYRRRVPKDVAELLRERGFTGFKKVLGSTQQEALSAYPAHHARIERAIKEARRLLAAQRAGISAIRTDREIHADALLWAREVLGEDAGEDEPGILVDSILSRYPVDPEDGQPLGVSRDDQFRIKALSVGADAPPPPPTVEDARRLYVAEKKLDEGQKVARQGIDRALSRVAQALGKPLHEITLASLRREDARKVRDHLLSMDRKGGNGEKLSKGSVQRDINRIKAVVSFGIREFDLHEVKNPFDRLPLITETGEAPGASAKAKREPLPESVIRATRARLNGDLRLIWRLLAGTGCRVSEIAGLRGEDVRLGDEFPHIKVAWHEGRRVKTASSIRAVPLIGDAFEAAKEALSAAQGATYLFPQYVHARGGDAVSGALMKHLRKETTDKRHVVHSLRHNLTDALRLAGVSKTDEDAIIGHAAPDVAVAHYGSERAVLQMAYEAMKRALGE